MFSKNDLFDREISYIYFQERLNCNFWDDLVSGFFFGSLV